MIKPKPLLIAKEIAGAETDLEAAILLLKNNLLAQAVSLSYEALLHAVRAALWSHGKIALTHRGLVNQFGEEFIKTRRIDALYATILIGHRERREMAVVDVGDFQITEDQTAETVHDAEKFLNEIQRILP